MKTKNKWLHIENSDQYISRWQLATLQKVSITTRRITFKMETSMVYTVDWLRPNSEADRGIGGKRTPKIATLYSNK